MALARALYWLLIFSSCLTAVSVVPVNVTVNWDLVVSVSHSIPTIQAVVNPIYRRGSLIHDKIFQNLELLQANYVRVAFWFPYPRLVVAELYPPSGNPQCATGSEEQYIWLSCSNNAKITKIGFASFGTPTGKCGHFQKGNCFAGNTSEVISRLCIGRQNCSILVSRTLFGDPCVNVPKHLSVEVYCTPDIRKTYWNFTLIDPLMEDMMNALGRHSMIASFSTFPQWMFNTPQPVPIPDDPNQVHSSLSFSLLLSHSHCLSLWPVCDIFLFKVVWDYEQGTELRDWSLTELTEYNSRLVQWYTNGGFVDEYGNKHESGHYYHIPYWEVGNEIDFEHYTSVEEYTRRYDAIVNAIRKINPQMQFVGLALEGHREWQYYTYFLNHSNHVSGTPIDWISYHFYALTESRDNVTLYETFFPQADNFIDEVKIIQSIRNLLSPLTKTTIDEVGCILPNDNVQNPSPIPNIYWNACAANFAYLFSKLRFLEIPVVGQSQLVGFPTQYPSVSMINWNTGNGNARYWVLKLLIEYFHDGDKLLLTNTTREDVLHAQAHISLLNSRKVLLLVNKTKESLKVTVNNAKGATMHYVDEFTGDNPPATTILQSDVVALNPFAVAILLVRQ